MFWQIYKAGGFVAGRFNGEYHLFTTRGAVEARDIAHSVSADGVHWRALPEFMGHGAPDAFDAHTLYDLHVMEHRGLYYLHYTGLDIPMGPGQHQAIGLCTSRDLVHWERHSTEPVLIADPKYYEPFVPDEATYQEKDRRRQWFRDPWIYRNPATGQFGMAVGARAAHVHPDINGCFSWAVSDDLIHWESRPPLYCPQRFHTIECPVIFDQSGCTYLIWLTHPEWGTPLVTTDPWQRSGAFYAISDAGIGGPFRQPKDEILIGGAFAWQGRTMLRAGVVRPVVGEAEPAKVSYHLLTRVADGDDAASSPWVKFAEADSVLPMLKPVRVLPDGDLAITCNPLLDQFLDPASAPGGATVKNWRKEDGRWIGKNFGARTVQMLDGVIGDGVFSAQVRVARGLRAGLIIRSQDDKKPGLQIVLDHNLGCIEFGLAGAAPLDRRRWQPHGGWVELRIVALGPSIEIYCDGKLMLHQVRYSEVSGRVGLMVDQAEAEFQALELRALKAGTPLLAP